MDIASVLLLGIAFFASIISGITGFGAGVITLAIGSLFFDFKSMLFVLMFYFIAQGVNKTLLFFKHVDWKTTAVITFSSLPFVILGAFLVLDTDTKLLQQALGGLILLYIVNTLYPLIKGTYSSMKVKALFGVIWGFFSGFVGAAGPVKAILLDHIGMRKEVFIGTMAASAVTANIVKLFFYRNIDSSFSENYFLLLGLVFASLFGTMVGKKILTFISADLFRKFVLGLLFVMSIKLLFF